MKTIVNIINFVRAVEPRPGREDKDLLGTMKKEARLMRSLGLKGSFLLQYDALISEDFVNVAKENLDFCDIGLWLEIVRPQVEAIGESWRGRYPWDWHNDVGFLIGYEPRVRRKLIDAAMEKFKSIFGFFPKSVGSWHIDAVSMKYIYEKYGVDAVCICRDQVGTDGYTMQGGYYNGAYYPSIHNMFCPAQDKENQINIPVFRMLGPDPVLCYEFRENQGLIPTLEPAQLGINKKWCDWYLGELTCGYGISFAYTQAGQENSFGWEKMKEGLEYQLPIIKKLSDEGKADIMTLAESGRWFKEHFDKTPSGTLVGMSEWNGEDMKATWYYSRFYRASLKWERGIVRIRDMYVFDDRFSEHYIDRRCESHDCEFRNLPVIDGKIYSAEEIKAGIYLCDQKEFIRFDSMEYSESANKAFVTLTSGEKQVRLIFGESFIEIDSDIEELVLKSVLSEDRMYGSYTTADSEFGNHNCGGVGITYVENVSVENNEATLIFGGFEYAVKAEKGSLVDFFTLLTDKGKARLTFPRK